ncbi:NAD-dependent epimerase/dehydratase family protein [Cellulomonas alba]|uniref:NAD-dependent epimerase/dehydratase family protein n=1 Tax=Cellulomonas alba TaxID=3053467 RepID=A0ABT7SK62_9CELL|nr:NAD-dependent epimerase/dehydratase family protein [Cellulomonas alba]MDM7856580.1 NAD-dependent epimerase/dehydratase family protein [Cellulomonas alba]
MQVFVTGGTGYVGGVLVEHLLAAGHDVRALARSEHAAQALAAAGAAPVRGSLADLDVLRDAAANADAVVHAAVEQPGAPDATEAELRAVAALVAGAASSGGDAGRTAAPVVYTSTALVYGFDPAQDTSEDAALPQISAQPFKAAAERLVLESAGITPIVLRPGLVHGRGGSGLVRSLVEGAAVARVAAYVDSGENAWSAVHVDDLAALYVTAVERPVAGVFNVAEGAHFTFRELAEAIADLTGTVAASVPLAVAEQRMGPLARVLATTSRLSAERAREAFGWRPAGPMLLDDVRAGSYRAAAVTVG